jgi:16S rRNA C1402 (ribose-2'-O) methylase RsmI
MISKPKIVSDAGLPFVSLPLVNPVAAQDSKVVG